MIVPCGHIIGGMHWTRRLFVALPLAIATALNVLMVAANKLHLHREHIVGYGFLFALPWAWVLDAGWFGSALGRVHTLWMQSLVGYAIILWIPALLYSLCLWFLFAGLRVAFQKSRSNRTQKVSYR